MSKTKKQPSPQPFQQPFHQEWLPLWTPHVSKFNESRLMCFGVKLNASKKRPAVASTRKPAKTYKNHGTPQKPTKKWTSWAVFSSATFWWFLRDLPSLKLRIWHLCVSPERRSLTERCWKKCATEFSVCAARNPSQSIHPFAYLRIASPKKTSPKSQKIKGRHCHILACPFCCAKTARRSLAVVPILAQDPQVTTKNHRWDDRPWLYRRQDQTWCLQKFSATLKWTTWTTWTIRTIYTSHFLTNVFTKLHAIRILIHQGYLPTIEMAWVIKARAASGSKDTSRWFTPPQSGRSDSARAIVSLGLSTPRI